jgi:hypothetical protein
MLKGTYEQAFYVGTQIQLATDAPQLIENNQKLDELILKTDTNLDVKVSTRATLAQIESSTVIGKKADLVIINNGVKKASKFIPHNTSI